MFQLPSPPPVFLGETVALRAEPRERQQRPPGNLLEMRALPVQARGGVRWADPAPIPRRDLSASAPWAASPAYLWCPICSKLSLGFGGNTRKHTFLVGSK